MKKNNLKETLRSVSVYKPIGASERRKFREASSELAHEENIIFVAVGDWVYKRIEHCTQEQKETYYRKQLSQLQTQYFNRLVPLKKHLRDSFLKEVHEGTIFEKGDYYG